MKCFYHLERDASGECRVCGKPLCPECLSSASRAGLCRKCGEGVKPVSDALGPLWGILSIVIPGLGQLARGEYVKAVAIFIVVVFSFGNEHVLLGLLAWAAGAWDGFSPLITEDELGVSRGSKRWVVGTVLILLGLVLLPGTHSKILNINVVIPGAMVVLGALLVVRKAGNRQADLRGNGRNLEEGG